MRIVTGYSDKSDGLLVVSKKPLAEIASGLGLKYLDLKDVEELDLGARDREFFVCSEVMEEDVRESFKAFLNPLGHGIWEIWCQEVEQDKNLTDAVCW